MMQGISHLKTPAANDPQHLAANCFMKTSQLPAIIAIRRSLLFLFCLMLAFPTSVLANWGYEVHRANDDDMIRLGQDVIGVKMEIQRLRSGVVLDNSQYVNKSLPGPLAALDANFNYWTEKVLFPAIRVSRNPAASCAQAQFASQKLLEMEGQRQKLGLDVGSEKDAQLMALYGDLMRDMFTRCREESLDECVATGRYEQIIQTAFAEGHQLALIGQMTDSMAWANDALGQCAIYELRFSSDSKIEQAGMKPGQSGMKVERIYNGKIPLTVDRSVDVWNTSLYGETQGNITDVQLKCFLPGVSVICKPGSEIDSGFKAWIRKMEMRHREFYVDADDVSRERMAGVDKLPIELSGDAQTISMLISVPNAPAIPAVEWPAGGLAFYTAHSRDKVMGGVSNVKFERDTRGRGYPILFEFTYADQNTANGLSASDTTVFKLVHTPHPKGFPPRDDGPIRKPLIPKKGQ
jgi:hypothetical protein